MDCVVLIRILDIAALARVETGTYLCKIFSILRVIRFVEFVHRPESK
jgi:hypothetical protein